MKTLIQGQIVKLSPTWQASVEKGVLTLSSDGEFEFLVDTGFAGGIAVPATAAGELDLKFVATQLFELAGGQIIELAVFIGKVRLGSKVHRTQFIVGDALIGMRFLRLAGKELVLRFDRRTVTLKA